MGVMGLILANNLFEIAGAILIALAFYRLGCWRTNKRWEGLVRKGAKTI